MVGGSVEAIYGHHETGRFRFSRVISYLTHPAVAGGRLYLRDQIRSTPSDGRAK